MYFTPQQIEELLNIIDKNQLVTIGQELGPEFLTNSDKSILADSGIDWKSLYNPAADSIFTSFHFGMLAEALQAHDVATMTYDDIKKYIEHGDYIPMTVGEQAALNSIKAQTYNDVKKLGGRIFSDINQIGLNRLSDQQKFLSDEIAQGYIDKKTAREIANDIARKTGDWSRDFDRIVTYTNTLAYETGKAAMITRQSGEEDPLVYKHVYDGACKHCIRLYLTNGLGSKPIIFRLSELVNNGTNIGRKTDEWKATLGPVHPYCRCTLKYLRIGYIWDEDKKAFVAPKRETVLNAEKPLRKPIRITVAGKEYSV